MSADIFPTTRNISPCAEQQLAELYLQQDNYAAALKIFHDFAHADDVERSYRAFGLAGECVAYSLQGSRKKARPRPGNWPRWPADSNRRSLSR